MDVNFSSTKLGQCRVAEFHERIRKQAFPNLYVEVNELRKNNKLSQAVLKKLQKTQESIQKNESSFFEQHPFYGNLLTVLYLHLDQNDDSDEVEDYDISGVNSHVLKLFPGNITAKLNHFYICICDEDNESAEKIVDGLEQRYAQEGREIDVAIEEIYSRIDIAYLYLQLDPKLYYKSIRHYETALTKAAVILGRCNENLKKTSDIVKRVMKDIHVWQYYLLVTYNRLLNSGFLCIQEDSSEQVRTREMCFLRICELGKELLITEEQVQPVVIARTLVDLYDAHFKMKFERRDDKCFCSMCTMLCEISTKDTKISKHNVQSTTYKSFLSLALEMAPSDGHILERIGRLKRITAVSENHLHEAKEMLEQCVSLFPTRHVAWHQLGKTYRSLWLFPDHRDFYSNAVRVGHQKKKTKKKSSNNDLFCVLASEVATWGNKDDSTEDKELAVSAQMSTGMSIVERNKAAEQLAASQSGHAQILPETPVIKSRKPARDKPLKHHRKTDWFDRYRIENPLVSEKDQPKFLKKALECFQKANDIVNGTLCQLWVDLARLHISMQNFKQAERCFTKGKKCLTATLHDKAYLYEQWGLFTHVNLEQLEKAKSLYRHAVEYSVQSFERSKVAFYNLRDILQDQLRAIEKETSQPLDNDATGNMKNTFHQKLSLEKEYALLQKLVANFAEAKSMLCEIMSRETWKGQKGLRNLAWDLMDIFATTECFEDAWCYINSNLIYTAEKKHHKLILNVAFGLAKQLNVIEDGLCENVDEGVSQSKNVLAVVFSYLSHSALKRTASEGMALQKDASLSCSLPISRSLSECNTYPSQAYDLLLVTDDDEPPAGYAIVRSSLLQCGLSVRCQEDIMPGTRQLQMYSHFAEYAKVVIIFTDDIMTDQKRQLHYVAQSIIDEVTEEGWSTHVVCLHSDVGQTCDLHKYANVKVIGITDLSNGQSDTKESLVSLRYGFLRKLFGVLFG